MYCGVMLTGDPEGDCAIAFLSDDGVETLTARSNEDIVAAITDHRPSIVAINAPPERPGPDAYSREADDDDAPETGLDRETAAEFRTGEEDLIADGYSVLPQGMRDRGLLERAEHLNAAIQRSGTGAEVIESDPTLVSQKLDITGDDDLADRDISTAAITTAQQFDAVLLALLAKLHDEDETTEAAPVTPDTGEAAAAHPRDTGEAYVDQDPGQG